MTYGPIIVFDSGIGGLSIYRPLKQALPEENIVYMTDSNHFPYGNKSSQWLTNRFKELAIDFKKLSPKLVVLACNSATTNVITDLRNSLDCPVVGVEPVIKPLANFTHALALMTEVSASSDATKKLLLTYGDHVRVYIPHGLASAIEYNDFEQVQKCIHEIKVIVQEGHIEAIGLSCTHYPLVLKQFEDAMPGFKFIDPSSAVVKEVIRVLESTQI
jgi:glutamate racemase